MEEKFEDWKGGEIISKKRGGITAASIACGIFLKTQKNLFICFCFK